MSDHERPSAQPDLHDGVAHYPLDGEHDTESFAFVLLPQLSMNAFSAAVDPLRLANQLTRKRLFRWKTVSLSGERIRCSNGIELGTDGDLSAIEKNDIVLVCAGVRPEASLSPQVSDWLRHRWRSGGIVGGICTGAYTLAQAGILKDTAFTLHWENSLPFQELFSHLTPSHQPFIFDKRIWTSAGGIAAMDMMIAHIAARFDAEIAGRVADLCLLNAPRRSEDRQIASMAARLGVRNPKLLRVIQALENNLEHEIDLDEITGASGVSRRQTERLFAQHLNMTPTQFLTEARLSKARTMLAETNLSVNEVAAACGFPTTTNFSRRFRTRFNESPYTYSTARKDS